MANIDDLPNEVLESAFLCLYHLPDKVAVIGVSKRWREIGAHARNLWRTSDAPEPLWLPLWMAHHLCFVVPRGLSLFIDISAVVPLSLVLPEDELQNIARACEGLRVVDCPQDYKSRVEPFVDNLVPFMRALAGSNSQLRQLHVPPELVLSLHELVPLAFQSVVDYRPEPYPITAEDKKVVKRIWSTGYQDFVHACAFLPRLASVSASELWLMDKNTGRPNFFIANPDARFPCLRVIDLADQAIVESPLWIQFLQCCPLLERVHLGNYSPQAVWPADVQLQDLPPLRDIMYHYTARGYAFPPIFPERPLPHLERLRVLNWFPDATRNDMMRLSRVLQHTPRLQSLTLEMTTGRTVPFSGLLPGCLRLMAHDDAAEMENLLRVGPLLTRVECVGRREYRDPPSRCLVRLRDVIFGEVTDAMHARHYFSSPSWDIDPSQFDRLQAQETLQEKLGTSASGVVWQNQSITRAAESPVAGSMWDVSIKITLQRLPREEGNEWKTELTVEIVHSRSL